jgi:hypothetical protein
LVIQWVALPITNQSKEVKSQKFAKRVKVNYHPFVQFIFAI